MSVLKTSFFYLKKKKECDQDIFSFRESVIKTYNHISLVTIYGGPAFQILSTELTKEIVK